MTERVHMPIACAEINRHIRAHNADVQDIEPEFLLDDDVGPFLRVWVRLANGHEFSVDTRECAALLAEMQDRIERTESGRLH